MCFIFQAIPDGNFRICLIPADFGESSLVSIIWVGWPFRVFLCREGRGAIFLRAVLRPFLQVFDSIWVAV
jgi:hypothetical protein